ncbi:hypothetical protein [Polaromonas glacialis]|uniref:hypothetical protein n=1 Tax=Polaromonas glacialis TaxID=866564 RepID=UPI0012ECA574|nr:hypothetical protein [Polaromonas glacialis]
MTEAVTTKHILQQGLKANSTANTKAVLNNADLFAFLLTNFNNTLKLVSGNSTDVVLGLTNKALSTTKLMGKSSSSQNVVVGVTAAQIILTTASLVSVAGKGPASAVVAVGAAFVKKTSLALGLAGKDDKQAKCLAALTDLAASGLTVALVAPTAVTGIGAVLLAGGIAQLILSGYNAHQACIAPK